MVLSIDTYVERAIVMAEATQFALGSWSAELREELIVEEEPCMDRIEKILLEIEEEEART